MVKWLYKIKPTINITDNVFKVVCTSNQLKVAQWLCELNPLKYYIEIQNNKIINWCTKQTITINQIKT